MRNEQKDFAEIRGNVDMTNSRAIKIVGDEVPHDETFSFDGYQVVRGEFFAHINEPIISFCGNIVSVNTACIRRLPEVEYIQILIHQEERNLVIRPCFEDEKEAFVWCTRGAKRTPKQVTGREFMSKLVDLTGWTANYRYKLLGRIFRSGDEVLFVFNLDSVLTFPRMIKGDGKYRASRTPVLPLEWKEAFGPTVAEHRRQMEARVFKGYTVISVIDNKKPTESSIDGATSIAESTDNRGGT